MELALYIWQFLWQGEYIIHKVQIWPHIKLYVRVDIFLFVIVYFKKRKVLHTNEFQYIQCTK